jgi:threonine/homoserine/homoserine lactone efflux protein
MSELIGHFPAFIATTLLLAIVPGQGVAMIMRQAILGGARTALFSLWGHSTGLIIWGALSGVGLSAIFAHSDFAYSLLKWIGVAFLLFLSLQTALHVRKESGKFDFNDSHISDSQKSEGKNNGASAYRVGLIANLTNVKAAIFAVAFLPTFVPRDFPLGVGIFIFGCVWAMVSTSWYLFLIWSIDKSAEFIQRPKVRRALTAVSAVGIFGLAVGLALTSPH